MRSKYQKPAKPAKVAKPERPAIIPRTLGSPLQERIRLLPKKSPIRAELEEMERALQGVTPISIQEHPSENGEARRGAMLFPPDF